MRAGGHQQRAAGLQGVRQQVSRLARWLKERFAWGLMHATTVQHTAHLAVEDHSQSPADLIKLAGLGAKGKYPSHCHHELVGLLQKETKMPEPMAIVVPMKQAKRKMIGDGSPEVVDTETSMVLPYEVFSYMYHQHPNAWASRFAGVKEMADVPAALARFWQQVPNADPRKGDLLRAFRQRPGGASADIWQRAVPIAIHGDGFPVGRINMEAISWSGMLGKAESTIDQKILVSGMINKCKADTTQGIWWPAMLWGFRVLQSGNFPTLSLDGDAFPMGSEQSNQAGQPIADGFFCVLWTIKGDLEWVANGLQLEHTGGYFPCSWCQANRSSDSDDMRACAYGIPARPWYDYSASAAWRSSVWSSVSDWRSAHGGLEQMHPIFAQPGISIFNLQADVLP